MAAPALPHLAFLIGYEIAGCALVGAAISAAFVASFGVKWLLSRNSNHRRKFAFSAVLLVLCVAIALLSNWGAHDDTHRSPLLSRAGLRQSLSPLVEWRERAAERRRLEQLAALDPIDAHTHITRTGPAFVGMLERLHMHVLDILYVDDTSEYRSSLEHQRSDAMRFIAESKGHATLCTTFDPFQFNSPNFSRSAIEALNHDFDQGAVAAKVWKNIGMEVKNASGEYVLADDLVFQPIYSDIAARGKTLIIHAADPDGAWDPQARIFRNKGYFDANPQWDMSKVPTAPRKESILHARDHMLAVNPGLRVVGAHLGSMETQLDDLAQLLDRYPNFAIDTAARVRHLATQPRDKVRAFLLKYQDRVLYGTDLSFDVGSIKSEEETSGAWEAQYALDWRYFATNDTFQYMGREVEGLNLSPSILKQLYHDNALRWIPGISTNVP